MKKITVLLLTLCLTVPVLCGCFDPGSAGTAVSDTATITETEKETESETETEQETEETVINTVYKNGNVTVTEQNGVYTFCDSDNTVLLRGEYDRVSEMLPGFLLLTKNNLSNLFDTNYVNEGGKRRVIGLMFDKPYDRIYAMGVDFSDVNNAFVVKDGDIEHPVVNGRLYDIDCTNGCYVKEGFLWAKNKDDKQGLYRLERFNDQYNVVYPAEAEEIICTFNAVDSGDPTENERSADFYLFVRKNDKYALHYVSNSYNESAQQLTDFVYDCVTRTPDGLTCVMRDGVQYALDGEGNETRCDLVTLSEADGLKIVKYSAFRNTYGVTDGKGNTIIPPEYWLIEYLDGGFFCSKYSKFEDGVVIDQSGKALTSSSLRFAHGFHAPDNKNTLVIADYAGELTGNVSKDVLVGGDGRVIVPDLDYNTLGYAENDTYMVSLKNGETCTVNNKGEVIDN